MYTSIAAGLDHLIAMIPTQMQNFFINIPYTTLYLGWCQNYVKINCASQLSIKYGVLHFQQYTACSTHFTRSSQKLKCTFGAYELLI